MSKSITATMGLDVGDRRTHYCELDESTGEIVREGVIKTTRAALRELLADLPRMRVVLERAARAVG